MTITLPNQLLANLVLHFGIVVFVVGGLVFILVGNAMLWTGTSRSGCMAA